jgi:hypothetical protein
MAGSAQEHGAASASRDTTPLVPTQREPIPEALRHFLPTVTTPTVDQLAGICADLAEVLAWTGKYGGWQEHGSFLLHTSDLRWHVVGFSDPVASELIPLLEELPDFDSALLFDLIGWRIERSVILWARTPGTPGSRRRDTRFAVDLEE